MTDQHKIDLKKEFTESLVVHTNVKQEMIVTTVDKLRLCLIQHRGHAATITAWIAPFGILITLITALATAEFRDVGLSKEHWSDVFKYATGAVALWLLWDTHKTTRTLWKAFKSGSHDPVEAIVTVLKAQTVEARSDSVSPVAQLSSDALNPVSEQASEQKDT